jgi:hypothetical protein
MSDALSPSVSIPAPLARRQYWVEYVYDRLESTWLSHRVQQAAELSLVIIFLGALAVIELKRQGSLPAWLGEHVPVKHFHAIQLAFGALLLYEVIALVFGLARSVANALGQQLEILSLILLRSSFEELIHFDEPINWEQFVGKFDDNPLLHLIADASGALAIFVLLGIYYRLQRHQPITGDVDERHSFVAAKKTVALGLLAGFAIIGLAGLRRVMLGDPPFLFFEAFYTLLIFCDVLIVLISIRYTSTYSVVFRNSAFAVATILIRLTLSAPPFYNVMIGIVAAGFSVCLTLAYNTFAPAIREVSAE